MRRHLLRFAESLFTGLAFLAAVAACVGLFFGFLWAVYWLSVNVGAWVSVTFAVVTVATGIGYMITSEEYL